jgi:hypothetical protein
VPSPKAKANGWQAFNANELPIVGAPKQDNPFESSLSPADTDPFANPGEMLPPEGAKAMIDAAVKKAELKILKALTQVVQDMDYQGMPFSQVTQDLQDKLHIPIRINTKAISSELNVDIEVPVTLSLPSMTARSALRHILSGVSDDLTFTIRDEVLLITTKDDAAKDQTINAEATTANPQAATPTRSEPATELDTGAAFIEQWLKSSNNVSDPQALSQALQNHLENEFDANQKSRKTELERLRVMLKQSEEWINSRQTRRAAIIQKHLSELLEKQKQGSPAKTTR